MPDQPERREDLRWLLEPPGRDAVHLYFAMGEGREVTPEIREALERLVASLQAQEEVEGYTMCVPRLRCNLGSCAPVIYQTPCKGEFSCNIGGGA